MSPTERLDVSAWPGINPGRLRYLVTIQRSVGSSPPEYNAAGPALSWETFLQTYADIEPLRGVDKPVAGQTTSQTFIPITVRWATGILDNMRVVDGADTYVIQFIIDVGRRHVLLELWCVKLGTQP